MEKNFTETVVSKKNVSPVTKIWTLSLFFLIFFAISYGFYPIILRSISASIESDLTEFALKNKRPGMSKQEQDALILELKPTADALFLSRINRFHYLQNNSTAIPFIFSLLLVLISGLAGVTRISKHQILAAAIGSVVGIILGIGFFAHNPEGYVFHWDSKRIVPYLTGVSIPVIIAAIAFASDKFIRMEPMKRIGWTLAILVSCLCPFLLWRFGLQFVGAVLFLYCVAFWLFLFVAAARLKNRMDDKKKERRFQNQKEELIEAYDVKGWATNQDMMARIRKQGDNLAGGINIGGGAIELIWNEKGHILTCGYARSGKGTSIILPTLLDEYLSYDIASSFVVLDPKGENLAVAGNYLKNCGYNVIAINPFDIREISSFGDYRFNPFDLFNARSRDFNKYVDMIRFAIVPPQTQKHANSYFSEGASELLALYISHMMTQDKEEKTIKTLYRWLRRTGVDRFVLLNQMEASTYFDISHEARSIIQQLEEGGKSITDVYANVSVATGIFKDDSIRRSMETSDFNIADISKTRTAVFICLNPQDLQRMGAWVRLLIGSMMRGFTQFYNPNRKVVMLMDEFVTMGRLTEFEEGMGYLAGYNVTLWPIIQDLNQLKNLYPAVWETFVGNAAIKHWMVRDNFTAEYVSKRMPQDLIFLGSNSDGSPKEKEKPLMTPVEIMNCDDIIFELDGLGKPALLKKVPYMVIGNNHSPNPFHHN